ncbi:hypothetical protein HMPREF9123_2535 [Neisseria bacilliformis ATCC BAA-1200]|uniref:Uncharacterized protein n=1 Tax=Neisseria bacilliformis ATCC BAA-1200 TaxID=888742 RepID=F2BFM8_9NEIS|nr:hypothetical protein HMPREF9123_2535 [Neisseria bacilliformis ATCC BAA-1200]
MRQRCPANLFWQICFSDGLNHARHRPSEKRGFKARLQGSYGRTK